MCLCSFSRVHRIKSIQVERDSGNLKTAQSHMAKALQLCPESGPLWAFAIELEGKPQRKAKSYDALKKCHDDPFVFVAVAKYDLFPQFHVSACERFDSS